MAVEEHIEYRSCRLKITSRNGWQIKIHSAIPSLNARAMIFSDREAAIAAAVKFIDAGQQKFWTNGPSSHRAPFA
jgi:hypothetical protein